MNSDRLARILAASIARHQTRGLVDAAAGLTDVVIHGRGDLVAVARHIEAEFARETAPVRRSWGAWFDRSVEGRRTARQRAREAERLAAHLASGLTAAEAALVRLRLRELD